MSDYLYDEPYELDSPKHPSFHERYADHADMQRKRMKEDEGYAKWVRAQSLSEPGKRVIHSLDGRAQSEAIGHGAEESEETGRARVRLERTDEVAPGSESEEVEGHSR